ncbi:MAG: DNA polymerase/3'-5' exonuclease PolX [Calditrichaeota bacterium]|nr:DNA polymerase/3'-5' exonuclease PolX [Calditrichota bacterium]
MENDQIAEIFERLADILEFQGENPFKINAYRKASRVLKDLPLNIRELHEQRKVATLPGFGTALVKKVEQFLTTGKISKYEQLKNAVPAGLLQLLDIQNLGPRTLAAAHKKLGVKNLDDLVKVIENGKLAALPGMGEKKVNKIKEGVDFYLSVSERFRLGDAYPVAEEIIQRLQNQFPEISLSMAGSIRRMKETVHDLDILAATENSKEVIDFFVQMPEVEIAIAAGETKGSVRLQNKMQVDLRAVSSRNFGAALQYFTGSQAHNIKIRGIAKKQGLKINEYGLFRDDNFICGETEDEIYKSLGLQWIAPELREDRGEVEAAAQNHLPELIKLSDIKGDLHVHTIGSDGHSRMENLVAAAKKLGHQYLAICDHSRSAGYANGLSAERLLAQIEAIKNLNKSLTDFTLFSGSEVDILDDGSLDFPDEILARLDIVVVSIHSNFQKNPTERILTAMENPHVDIIAHPTGRLINKRDSYQVDISKIIEKAIEKNIALEINSHPWRLDLNDQHVRVAVEKGALLAINTDAHHVDNLNYLKFGVGTARRGWATAKNVINTLTIQQIRNWKKQRTVRQK